MNDFENQLRTVRLAAPSVQLDRRMEVIFQQSAGSAPAVHRAGSWWLVGLAATGAVAMLLLASIYSRIPPSAPVALMVHRVEPVGMMRESLLTPPVASQTPPAMIVTVRVHDSLPIMP